MVSSIKRGHLAASGSVRGQGDSLPRRAMDSLAPASPCVKKSESMARHLLRVEPPSSHGKIRPGGASGTASGPEISDTQDRCFSVDYHDACMARGSQINDPQALQPIRFQRAPGPHLLGGARPCVGPGMCTCACERGRPRLSGCAIGGAVPEVTDQLRISASQ